MLSNIKVGIRIKPPPVAGKERSQSEPQTVTYCNKTSLTFKGTRSTFDHVFPTSISQNDLYCQTAEPMLRSFMEGYNVTIMAYGQTGSGKTYTMHMGTSDMSREDEQKQQGLIPRFVADLFANLPQLSADEEADGQECRRPRPKVTVSFAEIYGEDVYDLMPACDGNNATKMSKDRPSLPLRGDEKGCVFVQGLREVQVNSAGEALDYLHAGTPYRSTASTSMNDKSSRSHAVFTVTLEQYLTPRGASRGRGSTELHGADAAAASGADRMISKLTFVDLAGSERLNQTNAIGKHMKEGIQINKGLLTLGKVINTLAENQSKKQGEKNAFVNYRESKLTRLLKDALGGNSQTLFLACVSPAESDKGLTKSTLDYAQAARNIQNKPVRNIDRTQMELRRLQYTVKAWMIKACGHMFSEAALSAAAAGSPSRLTGAARLRASPLPPSLFSESSSHANAQNEKESSINAPPYDMDLLKRPDVQEYVNAVNAVVTQRLLHDLGQSESILSPMKKHACLSLGASPVRPLRNIRSRVSHNHRDGLPAGRMARKCEIDDEAPRRGSVMTNLQRASTESLRQSWKYPEETERLVARMIEMVHEEKDMHGLQLDTVQQEFGEEKETILHQLMSSVKGHGAEMALLQDENRRLRARVEEFERQRASGLYEACKDCNASVRHSTSSRLVQSVLSTAVDTSEEATCRVGNDRNVDNDVDIDVDDDGTSKDESSSEDPGLAEAIEYGHDGDDDDEGVDEGEQQPLATIPYLAEVCASSTAAHTTPVTADAVTTHANIDACSACNDVHPTFDCVCGKRLVDNTPSHSVKPGPASAPVPASQSSCADCHGVHRKHTCAAKSRLNSASVAESNPKALDFLQRSEDEESDDDGKDDDDDEATRGAKSVSRKGDGSAPSRKGRLLRGNKIPGAESVVLSDDDMETLITSPVRDVLGAGERRTLLRKRVVVSPSDEDDAPNCEKSAGQSCACWGAEPGLCNKGKACTALAHSIWTGRIQSRGGTSMFYSSSGGAGGSGGNDDDDDDDDDEDEDEDDSTSNDDDQDDESLSEESKERTGIDESSGDDGPEKHAFAVIGTDVVRRKGSGTNRRPAKGERTYVCGYALLDGRLCEEAFTKSHHCTRHRRTHTGEKPFVCGYAFPDGNECDMAFNQSSNCARHIRTHTGERPYVCGFVLPGGRKCHKTFTTSSNCAKHKRTHTGEKPFVCGYAFPDGRLCNMAFTRSYHCAIHIRTHTGEKPYVCGFVLPGGRECDKTFTTSSDCVRHIRTHTGEKPYVCGFVLPGGRECHKKFTTSSNCNTHRRTQHPSEGL